MAASDLVITAANVAAAAGAVSKEEWVAGATIAAGDVLYMDTANSNVMKLAQADGTELEATVYGIALNSASADQPVLVARSGDLDIGAALTVAATYILSDTAGKLCLIADLASGWFLSIVGFGTAADNLKLGITNTGVEKA